jgi:ABC-type Fe3+/spermidine/putrescine transport system ATPase subunit
MTEGANAPAIEVEKLSIHYGNVSAVNSVGFCINHGEQLTLLGPSGCGKTSTLRAVAGLERPSSGAIRIGGRTVYDGAGRINLPAEQRGLSMVFQSYAIWPHMTVFDNVAYGLRVRNESGAALKEKVHHALDLVKMGAFAERNASQLSGGQQQRVALARACAFSSTVLLFDEPLSNLDAKLRAEMRIELRELQRRLKVTSLYVTHDLEEALAMSDRIVVMRAGNIEQNGTPNEIYNFPRTAFVADFVGSANLVNGRLLPERSVDGRVAVEVEGGNILLGVSHGRTAGPQPTLSLRTVHLRLSADRPASSENVWPVRVKRSVFLGDLTQVHVEWCSRELVIRQTTAAPCSEGENAYLSIDPSHCVLLEGD